MVSTTIEFVEAVGMVVIGFFIEVEEQEFMVKLHATLEYFVSEESNTLLADGCGGIVTTPLASPLPLIPLSTSPSIFAAAVVMQKVCMVVADDEDDVDDAAVISCCKCCCFAIQHLTIDDIRGWVTAEAVIKF